jgi:hypothetical protein
MSEQTELPIMIEKETQTDEKIPLLSFYEKFNYVIELNNYDLIQKVFQNKLYSVNI